MHHNTFQYAKAVTLNTWLIVGILLMFLIACVSVGANVWTVSTITAQPPIVVRVDSAGRAEVVQYDASGRLESGRLEAYYRYTLGTFVEHHFARRRATLRQDYGRSMYFMGPRVADRVIEINQQERVVETFLADLSADEVSVEVRDVRLRSISELPYRAEVDFDQVYISPGSYRERRRDSHTAQVAFVLLETVPAEFVRVNPLGLQITDLTVDQAFTSTEVRR